VISVCSTDDRYADDVHYMGGLLLASDMLGWAATMLCYNARPPSTARADWRELWRRRLRESPPFVEEWLRHQSRDAYWRHGSVCEDYPAITVPVWMVGGWHDPYRNAVLRFLDGFGGTARGLIGNWAHNYPHDGLPGPAAEWRELAAAWWERWLHGQPNDVDRWPRLTAWLGDRFVADAKTDLRAFELGGGVAETDLWTGAEAGVWCPGGLAAELPGPDDLGGLVLTADTAPGLAVLGFPEVDLEVVADRPVAQVCVRLLDGDEVVARGFARVGRADRIRLTAAGHGFREAPRVAISTSYWPWIWPSPEPVRLVVVAARLRLPVVVAAPGADLQPVASPAAEGGFDRRIERRGDRQVITYDYAHFPARDGYAESARDVFTIDRYGPLAARVRCERSCAVGETRVETVSEMWSTAGEFHVRNAVTAFERAERVHESERAFSVARAGI
jgi:hypothetical protein